MYIRTSRSGGRTYLRLVESFRDEHGRVQQRQIAQLGRADDWTEEKVETLVSGLRRLSGQERPPEGAAEFAPAREVGGPWVLTELWNSLQLGDALRRALRSSRREFDAEALIRVMVFNRLCDPESKLGVLRWLDGVHMPGLSLEQLTHQQLLRAMDALESVQAGFRAQMAHWIKPLLDQELSVVFYDLTTIRVQGEARLQDDLRAFGLNKDTGGMARQVLLGVVQSAEGIPLDFEIFAGNTAEVTTLVPMIQRVRSRYPIQRIVLVADRGVLSLDNVAEIEALGTVQHAAPDFILAVPAARYGDLHETLATLTFAEDEPSIGEAHWAGRRLVVAHDPELAARSRERREATLAELTALGDRLAEKLDAQDAGVSERGRRASDRGAYKRFHKAVSQAHFSRFIEADLGTECFSYAVKEEALEKARRLDGKLILITSCRDFAAPEVVSRYKALADIERGFRTLKSDIEIAPMYHRLPRRIWAHSAICFLALFLHRVMRMKIHSRQAPYSVTRAMEQLHAVQLHSVRLSNQTLTGISTLTPTQKSIFEVLGVAEPRMAAL